MLYPVRNPSFPFPCKKLRGLLFPKRKERRQKRMLNSCIVYRTQRSSRLLHTRYWRLQGSLAQQLDSWTLVQPSWMHVNLQGGKLFLSASQGCAQRRTWKRRLGYRRSSMFFWGCCQVYHSSLKVAAGLALNNNQEMSIQGSSGIACDRFSASTPPVIGYPAS